MGAGVTPSAASASMDSFFASALAAASWSLARTSRRRAGRRHDRVPADDVVAGIGLGDGRPIRCQRVAGGGGHAERLELAALDLGYRRAEVTDGEVDGPADGVDYRGWNALVRNLQHVDARQGS